MSEFSLAHPWDRRSNETLEAYQRFLGYLDWPGKMVTYAGDLATRLGVNPGSILQQAYANEWKARKEAWVATHAGAQADPTEVEQVRLRNRARSRVRLHAQLSEKFLAKAEKLVDEYMERELRDPETGEVVGTALVRGVLREASEALAKGIEMERLSYGLPGTITRVEHDLRTQVEVALNIQNRVLAVVTAHICAACQAAVAEELTAIQGEVDQAQREVLQLTEGG